MIIFSLVEQWAIHIPLLLGAYVSFYLLKIPDLSIESAYTFGAYCAVLSTVYYGNGPILIQLIIGISVSICAGGLIGVLSSFLTSQLKISHLLSTIMTTGIVYGVNQLIIGSYYSISSVQNPLLFGGIAKHPEVISLVIIAVVAIFFCIFFLKTELGFCIKAYGINNNFFKFYGISSRYIFIMGVVMANCLAGLSGYLQAQSNGFVDITMALNKSLLCLTALIFGKVVIHSSCVAHLGHPIVGGLLYFVLQYMLIAIGFDSRLFTLMQASVICLILGFRKQLGNEDKHSLLGI